MYRKTIQVDEVKESKTNSRFDELTNYINRNYGYFVHSNIMQAGIEAVAKNKTFFDKASKLCSSKTAIYTEEKIVAELADMFQKYHEFLTSQGLKDLK